MTIFDLGGGAEEQWRGGDEARFQCEVNIRSQYYYEDLDISIWEQVESGLMMVDNLVTSCGLNTFVISQWPKMT